MLMGVKNQIRVVFLSIKYSLLREMLNKVSFFMNIIFMIINNACFIVEWVIIYSIRDNIGGYTIRDVLLLWGISALSYGISHLFFYGAYDLSDLINNGKLDSYIIQPKNVLISAITSKVSVSAIGDIIYGYIMLFIYGFSIRNFMLFSVLGILGGFISTSFIVVLSCLAFYVGKSDLIVDTGNQLITSFSTYPSSIFKGISKFILFIVLPVGVVTYIPVSIIRSFNILYFMIVFIYAIVSIIISFVVFNHGLKRYGSSNLMVSRY